MSSVSYKYCKHCGSSYPVNGENFGVDLRQDDCVAVVCNNCVKHYQIDPVQYLNPEPSKNEYMREYNSRPEVRAARNAKRREDRRIEREAIKAEKLRIENTKSLEQKEAEAKAKLEARREYERNYRKQNKLANRTRSLSYLARKKGAAGNFTSDDIEALYKQSKGLCWWCGKDTKGVYAVDHRVPLVKGGTNYIENLCISCKKCNSRKGGSMPFERMGRLL